MILEVGILNVIPSKTKDFEKDFKKITPIIKSIKGFISLKLKKCLENKNRYLLLVEWETLESHTINFRKSEKYQIWRKTLNHYYEPHPEIEHYEDFI